MSLFNSSRPRVALFEPRIPQNTGTIGRSCLAFDMSLDIIKPTGFSFEDKYLKRAGLDYWANVDLNLFLDCPFENEGDLSFVITLLLPCDMPPLLSDLRLNFLCLR